ncbi:nucleoporin Nup35 [Aethina tumida]|uniref:nucleoporin Nup35 n=1 Tax=Aethina tumida TaxID=116153 RepID=UPI00096B67C2|nr:nucleoporin Nup35 [Aethina tumida]
MEPMTLGSAPSSPASPGINANFLPGFLMGDTQPTTPNPTVSPGRNRTSGSFKMGPANTDSRSLRQKLFNQSLSESPAPMSPFSTVSEKAGPPKLGLFDSIEQSRRPTSPIMSSTVANYNDSPVFNESISRIQDDSLNYSRNLNNVSELNRTMNASSRVERLDSNWVTVFGFPPSALTIVLSQMQNCGPIVDKKIPSVGNWVHIKFNNANEVSRALALNGRCIANQIMIGVQIYHNRENKENDTSCVYTSPIRARSLRHSFVSPNNSNTVIAPQVVPQKSTGIVTKAMEYVFGW